MQLRSRFLRRCRWRLPDLSQECRKFNSFSFGFEVVFVKSGDEIRAKYVVTCAGLHADRVAKKSGGEEIPKIVPFRGDYLLMAPDKAKWINGNHF